MLKDLLSIIKKFKTNFFRSLTFKVFENNKKPQGLKTMKYPKKFQVTQDSYFDSRRAILKDIALFNIFTIYIVLYKIIMT